MATSQPRIGVRLRTTIPIVVAAFTLTACSSIRIPFLSTQSEVEAEIDLIAIMPIDRADASPGEDNELAGEAEEVVTAAIYGALSSSYEWRFVPDLTVADAMRNISPLDSPTKRAVALGKAVNADAVMLGSVWRYVERVGTAYGADRAASVAFTLRLLSVSSGEVVWEETYDKTQEALSSNLFDWALFWEDGPYWLTAAELTNIGAESLIENLRRSLG